MLLFEMLMFTVEKIHFLKFNTRTIIIAKYYFLCRSLSTTTVSEELDSSI